MTPKTKHKYLGIEIECLSTLKESQVSRIRKKHELTDILEITDDGSIRCDPDSYRTETVMVWDAWSGRNVPDIRRTQTQFGYEFRVLTKEGDLAKNMKRIAEFLKDINATANDSCGLHVHIDCRERPFLDVFAHLVKGQKMFFKMVPKSRRKSTYCRETQLDNIFNGSRYLAINPQAYRQHKTIEVRLHEGTVDCEEIQNWCDLLITLTDKQPLTESQKSYVRKRTRKFA